MTWETMYSEQSDVVRDLSTWAGDVDTTNDDDDIHINIVFE